MQLGGLSSLSDTGNWPFLYNDFLVAYESIQYFKI